MRNLSDKAKTLSNKLIKSGVEIYHNPYINIITIRGKYISPQLAKKYSLVPDSHNANPSWYKIVVMDHVKQGVLDNFIMDVKSNL